MNQIRDKIFGAKQKQLTEDDIDNIHDNLMVEYGWIPLEEFKKIPMATLWGMILRINGRREAEKKEMEKSAPKRRLK